MYWFNNPALHVCINSCLVDMNNWRKLSLKTKQNKTKPKLFKGRTGNVKF